tara:strand:+ start:353 stop:748 length:396 start_codon:yes stop_codon:yes gene_type:complete
MSPLMCLAAAVFFESRSQPLQGQYAVAKVVMNRVESHRWPDNICDVVFQYKQFSFTHDGKSDKYWIYNSNVGDRQAIDIAETVARSVLKGDVINSTSTHYHAAYVKPFWRKLYHLDGRIGSHIFYTAPKGK